jgi:hypothetical protein
MCDDTSVSLRLFQEMLMVGWDMMGWDMNYVGAENYAIYIDIAHN